ncbi:hypothetical protein TNCV_266631 [Trichonephila clavipes]|nr:hypothetical protein TNCV_266631 [Trichonephila clavipes]
MVEYCVGNIESLRSTSLMLLVCYTTAIKIAASGRNADNKMIFIGQVYYTVGDRLTNTFKKDFLCLDNEHIFGGDQGDTPEIMDGILTTARDLELEVNEDDIEQLIMGHEDELTIEELQEILNEQHQETQRNVSPSEQEEDERGQMPTSAT